MYKAEQVTVHSTRKLRKEAKRMAGRARRRAERLNPENAPTTLRHVIRGYAD